MFLRAMGWLNGARRTNQAAAKAAPVCSLELPNRIIADVVRDTMARFFNLLKSPRLTKPA